jgi:outer membrane protein OmpA-like peptidoglycan-associated protein
MVVLEYQSTYVDKINKGYSLNHITVKKQILVLLLVYFYSIIAFAQEKEIRPWSWFGYTGFIGVDASNKSTIGKQEALFTDYNPSLMVGGGGMYAFNQHFAIGPSIRIANASKPNFNIGIIGIGPIFQYNFIKTSRKFSPYIFIEPNFSFVAMNRFAHTVQVSNDTTKSSTGIQITEQNINISAAAASAGVFGLSSGIGLDYRIAQRWRFFTELGFNRHFTNNSVNFKENFKNVSALRYTDLVFGLRCDMVKIKKLNESDKAKVLAKIHKDSLNNKGSISIVGKLSGIQQNGDGISVLLVNEKGEIIKQTITDKEGYFVFSKIDKENYDVVLETPKQGVKADVYTESDESILKLDRSDLNDLQSDNKENVKEIIIGQALNKSTNLPASDLQVFLLNQRNELVAQTQTNDKGYFAYKDLPPADYKVVFSTQYPSIKSTVTFALSDSDILIAGDSIQKNSKMIIYGKVIANGSTEDLSQSILLIDKNGNVIKTTKSDKDGYFAFTKIPGVDYHVVINSNDHKLKVDTDYKVEDPNLFIDESSLPKFKYNKLSNDTTNKYSGQVITGKVTAKTPEQSIEDISMLLIDDNGNVIEKVKTDKEGNFKFTKLSPANFHVVFEEKNKNLKAEVFVPDDNTTLMISKDDLQKFNFKRINKDTSETHNITINGITRLANSNLPVEDVSVLLIDEDGNIVRREKTNKDGVFNFKHLSSANYQIRIESNNKNLKANFQVFDDQSTLSIKDAKVNQQPDTLIGTIYYGKNVFLLDDKMKSELDKRIKFIKLHLKTIKVINLDAYGDDTGTDEYNLWLTQKRAQAIYNYMVSKGINKKIIFMHPYGKALTINNANSVADPQLNRKTDIKIIK